MTQNRPSTPIHYLTILIALCLGACSPAPKTQSEAPIETKKATPAPPQFNVKFETSKGNFTIEVHRDWAPLGADRFYQLVDEKFFDDARFFRVVKGFVVQFGINKNPKLSEVWRQMKIPDDAVKESNRKGTITYATAGPGTRTTQLFINLGDNPNLDQQGFAPFGKVIDGLSVVENLYSGYGEAPDQQQLELQGNEYLQSHYERLDYIKTAKITP